MIQKKSDDEVILKPEENRWTSQSSTDMCIKLQELNLLNKQLFNSCMYTDCAIKGNTFPRSVSNGSVFSDIMLVDAFPTEYSAYTGCLTDERGYILEEALIETQHTRDSIYCTDMIKCHNVQDLNHDCVVNCLKHYFFKELEIVNPKAIILTDSAYKACVKYEILPADNYNYFTWNDTSILPFKKPVSVAVIWDFKSVLDSPDQRSVQAFISGLKTLLKLL